MHTVVKHYAQPLYVCRPLVSTLTGLLMSNVGLISPSALEYSIVNKYLLTMAVPLLLFSADLRYPFTMT